MKQYKQPKTRIKVVEDGWGTRYYAQAHSVLIPHLIEEWMIIRHLGDEEYCECLYEAQLRVDSFLTMHRKAWESRKEDKIKKRVKKKVQYIDYP